MLKIDLIQHPNQTFPITLEGNYYDIAIKSCGDFMVIDIIQGEKTIIQGQRILPNTPIIPYSYLMDGNLILTTENNQYPDWKQFGVTQQLYYVTVDEWQTMTQG